MPKITRPPEIMSSDATSLASVIGSRSTTRHTPVPSLSFLVTAGAAPRAAEGTGGWPYSFFHFGAPGEGRLARRGYVSVLGKEHRLEAAFFSRERKLDRLDCVVSREHRDSEFGHAIPPGSGDNGSAS